MAITAGILAGGKSERMGRNKAFLQWEDKTFLDRTAELFKDFSELLVSVDDMKCYQHTDYSLVGDEKREYGPIEGVYQLLKHSANAWVVLVSNDMPFLTADVIQALIHVEREDVQAVVLEGDGRIHPLCGMYHQSILPVCEQFFQEDEHRVHKLLEQVRTKIIKIEALGLSPYLLSNINTPEAYRQLNGNGGGNVVQKNHEPCVLAICGCKNSGKTTLIEKIIHILTERGHHIAYIKHDGHDFTADVPGTDSHRMQQSGALATAVFSDTQCLIYEKRQMIQIDEIIQRFFEYDLILIEGCKHSVLPKLEIIRTEVGTEPISNVAGRLGIVTDCPDLFDEEVFYLNDIDKLIQYITVYINKFQEGI